MSKERKAWERAGPGPGPGPGGVTFHTIHTLFITMSKRSPATQQNTPAPLANAGGEPIIFNPVSKWQEYVEVPGLTLFDIHREPRRVNEDPTARVRLQLKVRAHPL